MRAIGLCVLLAVSVLVVGSAVAAIGGVAQDTESAAVRSAQPAAEATTAVDAVAQQPPSHEDEAARVAVKDDDVEPPQSVPSTLRRASSETTTPPHEPVTAADATLRDAAIADEQPGQAQATPTPSSSEQADSAPSDAPSAPRDEALASQEPRQQQLSGQDAVPPMPAADEALRDTPPSLVESGVGPTAPVATTGSTVIDVPPHASTSSSDPAEPTETSSTEAEAETSKVTTAPTPSLSSATPAPSTQPPPSAVVPTASSPAAPPLESHHLPTFEEWRDTQLALDKERSAQLSISRQKRREAREKRQREQEQHALATHQDHASQDEHDAVAAAAARSNFASADCTAKVLSNNAEAQHASALLMDNRDYYMLNPCSAPQKWVVIELCEDLLVDTVEISSWELFSSRVKDFRVSVSDRFPVKSWVPLGTFTANEPRGTQRFEVASPLIWAKYVKFEFLSYHGSEFYCLLTQVGVYGTTMMEEFKNTIYQAELADRKAAEDEADDHALDPDMHDHDTLDSGINSSRFVHAEPAVDIATDPDAVQPLGDLSQPNAQAPVCGVLDEEDDDEYLEDEYEDEPFPVPQQFEVDEDVFVAGAPAEQSADDKPSSRPQPEQLQHQQLCAEDDSHVAECALETTELKSGSDESSVPFTNKPVVEPEADHSVHLVFSSSDAVAADASLPMPQMTVFVDPLPSETIAAAVSSSNDDSETKSASIATSDGSHAELESPSGASTGPTPPSTDTITIPPSPGSARTGKVRRCDPTTPRQLLFDRSTPAQVVEHAMLRRSPHDQPCNQCSLSNAGSKLTRSSSSISLPSARSNHDSNAAAVAALALASDSQTHNSHSTQLEQKLTSPQALRSQADAIGVNSLASFLRHESQMATLLKQIKSMDLNMTLSHKYLDKLSEGMRDVFSQLTALNTRVTELEQQTVARLMQSTHDLRNDFEPRLDKLELHLTESQAPGTTDWQISQLQHDHNRLLRLLYLVLVLASGLVTALTLICIWLARRVVSSSKPAPLSVAVPMAKQLGSPLDGFELPPTPVKVKLESTEAR
ncbi:hypothetical protein CAOG_01038 [Capsaspora owczarzaki ATCC 30864]|uniref:SUN domain-containing protein n=1 Tax=Capsaspora owczarzaki (strain ATCC 30864) TaxID=595528 RepID=A0A0D2U373_CAPO3|nr:hypothetical protein CAOG_01038 [Capsaspora owczarzaki ATCC 30864]KJE89601.1 hypothetical protein, variant 1 [Capsaspora owczarzaki ATCC 30864]|eukprot:XP_004365909.1 hypothetical protein CAOG_01038 [Capsaspora owczarzaki ATCC 30864]